MHESLLLEIETNILVLLLVACFAAIALQRFKFPYTVGLVIVGVGLGWLTDHVEALEGLKTLELSNEIILFIFVPPLIFESALNLNSRLLLNNIVPILTLAAPGLILSTLFVGFTLSWGTPLTLAQALLFGSLISATDPVAVIALFKELGAPKRLTVLVEGESLFNDATAIVTFNIILGAVALGNGFGVPELSQGLINFLVSFGGGIAAGAVIGLVARYPLALTREQPLLLATVSSVVAYVTFLIGEEALHVSGVIALVTTGIISGWYISNRLKPETRHFLDEFWEYAAFLANSLIFLLVGLATSHFQVFQLITSDFTIVRSFGLTIVAILIARALVVFGLVPLLNLVQPSNAIERRYQIISFWGGLRGAIALALALSLAPDFLNRDLIIVLTLGVALFTLLIPGTTMSSLMRSLKLNSPTVLSSVRQTMAQMIAEKEVLERLASLGNLIFPEVIDQFTQQQQQQLLATQQSLKALQEQLDNQDDPQTKAAVWLLALEIEQKIYRSLFDQGFISGSILSQLNQRVSSLQEAAQVGPLPPDPQVIRLPLELRWAQWRLTWFGSIFPDSPWTQQWQSQLIVGQYAYFVCVARACKQVPVRIQDFLDKSGIEITNLTDIQACLDYYAAEESKVIEQIDSLVAESRPITVNFQQQVMHQFAELSAGYTFERLVKEGMLDKSMAQ